MYICKTCNKNIVFNLYIDKFFSSGQNACNEDSEYEIDRMKSSVCLSIYLSLYLSVCLSINQDIMYLSLIYIHNIHEEINDTGKKKSDLILI